ncbi:hypothetical protein [Microbispora sp. ATCC PTA-5024]|uniref:hypothetical protein n=1 Tax=Microbispora sp. ATCC PTA-5024 TaxID=316330 RepID=UPI0003DDCD03|nr:hypothetical protein [Microbispora sp. ATCC PTA-5024]ETK33656.1 hypothetical protein MPTA5024_23755 [Microbispora sp. ATCC PTA-5024]
MAKVREFFEDKKASVSHPTVVDCGYQVVHTSEGVFLQLSTYGSDHRQTQKKTSQTLQLDHEHAAQLLQILIAAFPNLQGSVPEEAP